jgi:capsular polysaccharide biosynthesis protein/CO dehydrogenase nickel-insertion accessory protein CooC1
MGEYPPWRGNGASDDEPVDVPRYVAALKRGIPLMLMIVVSLTGVVLALSILLPKTYEATARIVMNDTPATAQAGDVETVKRQLATVQTLLTTRGVLERAAQRLSGEGPDAIKRHVRSSVDRNANIINVVADDGDPRGAAAIANAVSLSFLAMQSTQERRVLDRARAQLSSTIQQLRGTPGSSEELRALRERLSELGVTRATAGTDLQLAQAAQPPTRPASPRPIRNTVVAFFAAVFIALLAALGLDQLAPRLAGARQLSRLARLPILAVVPRSRRGKGGAEAEDAFAALQASLVTQLAPAHNVVLVANLVRRDDRADISAGISWTLARSGYDTLLVCADVGNAHLSESLGVSATPGLTDALAAVGRAELPTEGRVRGRSHANRATAAASRVADSILTLRADDETRLDVMPAGELRSGRLLASDSCGSVFEALRRSGHRFVIVDGPPLLGTVEGQLIARHVDAIVVVCRVDRMSPAAAVEIGEQLAELPVKVLGAVAVGARDVVPQILSSPRERLPGSSSRTQARARPVT